MRSDLDFEKSFKLLMELEGGLSDHPSDKGGRTNFGITQTLFDIYSEDTGKPKAKVDGMREFEAKDIYMRYFWRTGRCYMLLSPLNFCLFQFGVNSGVKKAVIPLQRLLGFEGTQLDGVCGHDTVEAANKVLTDDPMKLVNGYLGEQDMFYEDVVSKNPEARVFLNGWHNRVEKVRRAVADG